LLTRLQALPILVEFCPMDLAAGLHEALLRAAGVADRRTRRSAL
jgi:hypothetical protein